MATLKPQSNGDGTLAVHGWAVTFGTARRGCTECNSPPVNASVPTLYYLPPIKEEVHIFSSICLSVCLLARLLKNACKDLDEMLRIDRC